MIPYDRCSTLLLPRHARLYALKLPPLKEDLNWGKTHYGAIAASDPLVARSVWSAPYSGAPKTKTAARGTSSRYENRMRFTRSWLLPVSPRRRRRRRVATQLDLRRA